MARERTIEQLERSLAVLMQDVADHQRNIEYYQRKGGNTDFAPRHIREGYTKNQQWLAEAEQDCSALSAEIERRKVASR